MGKMEKEGRVAQGMKISRSSRRSVLKRKPSVRNSYDVLLEVVGLFHECGTLGKSCSPRVVMRSIVSF